MRTLHILISTIVLFLGTISKSDGGDISTVVSLGKTDLQLSLDLLRTHAFGNDTSDLQNKCGFAPLAIAYSEREQLSLEKQEALRVVLARPVLQKNKLVGRFRVHYDTTGTHAPLMLNSSGSPIPGTAHIFADSVASIANYVLVFETDSLGYLPPPEDFGGGGGPEYDIYIMELGNLYGETVFETSLDGRPSGGKSTSFIRIDNDFVFVTPDSNKGMPALRVTLAHELHHAIQIGSYGFWGAEIYFYEMTSTWLEDVLYPEVNDYFQYVRSPTGHFRRPDVPFTSNEIIMYSRAIWGHFAAKKYGRTVMRHFWEEIANVRPLQSFDNVLQASPYSTSFRSAYTEWTLWNYFTGTRTDPVKYYPEGDFYPTIIPSIVEFASPSRMISGSLAPLSSRYYDVLANGHSIPLTISNVNSAAALTNSNTTFPYTILLNKSRLDEGYKGIGADLFMKLEVPDATNWFLMDIFGIQTNSTPFPNPFRSDGKHSINIPIDFVSSISGTVYIFNANMDLVFSEYQRAVFQPQNGKQVFKWAGRTGDGELAGSGIYFFVVDLPSQTFKGKFALIRN